MWPWQEKGGGCLRPGFGAVEYDDRSEAVGLVSLPVGVVYFRLSDETQPFSLADLMLECPLKLLAI